MQDRADFWNRLAKRYAAKKIDDVAAYERKLRLTQDRLEPWMTVLELGCGTGATAVRHAPFVSAIHAVDLSAEMIDIARRRASDAGVANVTFESNPVEMLRLPDGSQDVVMAHSLLHLMDEPAHLVGRAYRWLRPGGLFISNTACLAKLNPMFRALMFLGQAINRIPPLCVFDDGELRDMMTAPGFQIDLDMPIRHGAFLIARKPGRLTEQAT